MTALKRGFSSLLRWHAQEWPGASSMNSDAARAQCSRALDWRKPIGPRSMVMVQAGLCALRSEMERGRMAWGKFHEFRCRPRAVLQGTGLAQTHRPQVDGDGASRIVRLDIQCRVDHGTYPQVHLLKIKPLNRSRHRGNSLVCRNA